MVIKAAAAALKLAKTPVAQAKAVAAPGIAQMQTRVAELSRTWKGARTSAQSLELGQLQKKLALVATSKPPAALVTEAFKDPIVRPYAFSLKESRAELARCQTLVAKHGNKFGDADLVRETREMIDFTSQSLDQALHTFTTRRQPGFAKLSAESQKGFLGALRGRVEEKVQATRGSGVLPSPRSASGVDRVPKGVVDALRASRKAPDSAAAQALLNDRFMAHVAQHDAHWQRLTDSLSRLEEHVKAPGKTARRAAYDEQRLASARSDLQNYKTALFQTLDDLYPAVGRR